MDQPDALSLIYANMQIRQLGVHCAHHSAVRITVKPKENLMRGCLNLVDHIMGMTAMSRGATYDRASVNQGLDISAYFFLKFLGSGKFCLHS